MNTHSHTHKHEPSHEKTAKPIIDQEALDRTEREAAAKALAAKTEKERLAGKDVVNVPQNGGSITYEVPKDLPTFSIFKHDSLYVLRMHAPNCKLDTYTEDSLEGIINLLSDKVTYFAALLDKPVVS